MGRKRREGGNLKIVSFLPSFCPHTGLSNQNQRPKTAETITVTRKKLINNFA
jgi:hypothetical protein